MYSEFELQLASTRLLDNTGLFDKYYNLPQLAFLFWCNSKFTSDIESMCDKLNALFQEYKDILKLVSDIVVKVGNSREIDIDYIHVLKIDDDKINKLLKGNQTKEDIINQRLKQVQTEITSFIERKFDANLLISSDTFIGQFSNVLKLLCKPYAASSNNMITSIFEEYFKDITVVKPIIENQAGQKEPTTILKMSEDERNLFFKLFGQDLANTCSSSAFKEEEKRKELISKRVRYLEEYHKELFDNLNPTETINNLLNTAFTAFCQTLQDPEKNSETIKATDLIQKKVNIEKLQKQVLYDLDRVGAFTVYVDDNPATYLKQFDIDPKTPVLIEPSAKNWVWQREGHYKKLSDPTRNFADVDIVKLDEKLIKNKKRGDTDDSISAFLTKIQDVNKMRLVGDKEFHLDLKHKGKDKGLVLSKITRKDSKGKDVAPIEYVTDVYGKLLEESKELSRLKLPEGEVLPVVSESEGEVLPVVSESEGEVSPVVSESEREVSPVVSESEGEV